MAIAPRDSAPSATQRNYDSTLCAARLACSIGFRMLERESAGGALVLSQQLELQLEAPCIFLRIEVLM